MPRRREVPSLRELALKSVGEYVIGFGRSVVAPFSALCGLEAAQADSYLRGALLGLRQQLSCCVPWNLYDRMATEVLLAVRDLVTEIKAAYSGERPGSCLAEINVAVNLVHAVVSPRLRRIAFGDWPKFMRHALYDSLADMSGLRVLDLGSGSVGWRSSDIERAVVAATGAMGNLTAFTLCFDCTDSVLAAVCRHCCAQLQQLDVTASRSVTDRSIACLLKCARLRELKLLSTSVSVPGYASLLLDHPCLQDIGRYDELGVALEHIRQSARRPDARPLRLRAFECRGMSPRQLYLLAEMCPGIVSLSLLRDERVDDLAVLASLTELRELKLLSCEFYTNGVRVLLEVIGCNIVSLHLEHVGEIDLGALVFISQCCPNLRSLVFCNCEFLATATSAQHRKLAVPPFQHLERLKCVVDCAEPHLEFVLSHCVNVRFVHLGSSTGIGDATIRRVFDKNPMNKLEVLKILYSNDLSMSSVHLFMRNCENLRRLSELESWEGISRQELYAFREELRLNNFDLDTSPTLSLA
ncbi:uncharacterized protein LOC131672835 [Phymastichus coffea]|uniref:uncharacterized protein LOC131672835 n=1 Tax=Phymastichus coffea TaxID=108790 RepID=UPI00273B5820|nr:uncharacterized protein LOC131672835 [Phymastichus coffea]XP_058806311.1 uncharacterized protein LOC131672835 [Phymastichus coffea]